MSIFNVPDDVRDYRNSVILSLLRQSHPVPVAAHQLAYLLGMNSEQATKWMKQYADGNWEPHDDSSVHWRLSECQQTD